MELSCISASVLTSPEKLLLGRRDEPMQSMNKTCPCWKQTAPRPLREAQLEAEQRFVCDRARAPEGTTASWHLTSTNSFSVMINKVNYSACNLPPLTYNETKTDLVCVCPVSAAFWDSRCCPKNGIHFSVWHKPTVTPWRGTHQCWAGLVLGLFQHTKLPLHCHYLHSLQKDTAGNFPSTAPLSGMMSLSCRLCNPSPPLHLLRGRGCAWAGSVWPAGVTCGTGMNRVQLQDMWTMNKFARHIWKYTNILISHRITN